MARYCLDTSALLEGWARYYPPDVFPSLWARLDELISSGDVVCPDEVLVELEKKDDELAVWITRREKLVQPLTAELQLSVREILERFPRLVDSLKLRSQADPFVIGLARITGSTVVSQEQASRSESKPKIPDVCDYFGIRCILLVDFIREQRWNF